MNIFEIRESNVRSYCRSFPAIFCKAKGSTLYSESGEEYIDFLAGAGGLNYGHNNDYIKRKVVAYLESDGIVLGLDMHTVAKEQFLEAFSKTILEPRDLDYKIQFCGPTGTNAVEASLKLARKVTGRTGVFSFMGGYHGMSQGSLSVSGNLSNRKAAGVSLANVTFVPYADGFEASFDSIVFIESILSDTHSGIEKPSAIIFETVQAEGGIVVAPVVWMQRLRDLCNRHKVLLICDDIQVGCCRTGPFFSFERAGIVPDMVLLSKSISGYGAPMSLVLMKPSIDQWEPAEHTGTFRGYQPAFVGAKAALEYLEDNNIQAKVKEKGALIAEFLHNEIKPISEEIDVRGIGMIWGIDLSKLGGGCLAKRVAKRCFELGLVIEKVGRDDSVMKILPALTIEEKLLQRGCSILKQALIECLKEEHQTSQPATQMERERGVTMLQPSTPRIA